MSGDILETKVVWLGQDLNTTLTTLLPSYLSLNDSYDNMTNATMPPGPNMCGFKPPMEPWEVDLGFYLNGVITILVIALGLIGNMLTVIVLTNKTMRTSTNCFLMALAIWDSVVLFVTFFLICVPEFSNGYFRIVFPYIVAFIYPLGLVAQTITIWLTVSFTVERYIAVCHPLKAAVMCTIPRARVVVIGVCSVSLLYNLPRWFEYKVKDYTHDPTNDSCVIIEGTSFNADPIYHKIYFGWSYFLVMCVIPLLSLAILNTFLILAVRRSKAQRKDMNVRQSRENNVTIMLIAVVLLFMLFQVPALIYNMAYAIDIKRTRILFGWKVLSSIRNFLVNVNSAVNFILYCALGQKFRRTFVRTLCPQLRSKLDNFHSYSNYKMEKLKKPNGTTKYVKIAGKNNHMTSSTGDSGVITKCAGFSRYSSPVSVSKLSAKFKENNEKQNYDKLNENVEKSADINFDKNIDKENNVTLIKNVENGDKIPKDKPIENGSNDPEKKFKVSDSKGIDKSSGTVSKDNERSSVLDSAKDEADDSVTMGGNVETPDSNVQNDKSDSNVPNGKSVALPNHAQTEEDIPNDSFIDNDNFSDVSKSELFLLLDSLQESDIL